MKSRRIWVRLTILALIVLCGSVALHLALSGRLQSFWQWVIGTESHRGIFVALFVILPLVGFPISVFLVLLGAKFSGIIGVLIMVAGMAVHLAVGFPAANTLIRPLIEHWLSKTRYRLPQFPRDNFVWPSIVFMVIPGLSYTMKNYLLSLSGVPFGPYFIIGLLSQAIMGLPLLVAGDLLAGVNVKTALLVLIAFGGLYAGWKWFKTRRWPDR